METGEIQFRKEYVIKSVLISILSFSWSILSSLLVYKYIGVSLGKQTGYNYSMAVEFFLVVLFAPVIETILFQYLPINQVCISYSGKNKKIVAVCISAFCFGIVHFYSFYYFLSASIGGLLLAHCFYSFKQSMGTISAIFYIALVHSLSNFYIFLVKKLELL